MNALRVLFWKVGLIRLVVLEDYDGERNLRRLRKSNLFDASGDYIGVAERMGFGIRSCCLKYDGSIPHGGFVRRWYWYPVDDPRNVWRELKPELAKLAGEKP